MHEKFRHFIEDFQMKGCPGSPNLELVDVGCTHSISLRTRVCALLSPFLFLDTQHVPHSDWGGKYLCSVPGEGTAFLPVHLQIAVVMGRKFLREIQHTDVPSHIAPSLLLASHKRLHLRWVQGSRGGCWAAPCALRHPRGCCGCLEPATQPESTQVPGHCGLQL